MAFSFYSPLTVTSNSALLPSTQSNFQLLIHYTDNRFKSVPNGGHVQDLNGFDIRPYSGSTPLDYELVHLSQSLGELQMWIEIPSLALGTVINLYYGDPTLTTDGSNLTNVWKNNSYIGVYHHEQATGANAPDSSGNTNTGTANGTPTSTTAGKIVNGIDMSGSDWYITPRSAFGTNSALTFECWARSSTTGANNLPFTKTDTVGAEDFYIRFDTAGNIRCDVTNATGTEADAGVTGGITYAANTFYHIVGTYDGSTVTCYVNGAVNGNTAALTGNVQDSVNATINQGVHLLVGGFHGRIDEIRLSSVSRSADWVKAEYNNQNDPTTFVALGTETTPGVNNTRRSQFFLFFPRTST